MNAVPASLPASPDLAAIKQRQQAAWSSGNYAVVGTTLQIVGERLAEAVDLRWDERVLDVAAGNGNATLAAARRGGQVVSTDYVPALLDLGQARAEAEQLQVAFAEADAEALPFADASFDVVLSTFGVMFTPDHARAAGELARVCRPGGRIGLANWTPEGFVGQLLKLVGQQVPPPPGLNPPTRWGQEAALRALFAGHDVAITPREFMFRYLSARHWLDVFRACYGPVHRAFAALTPDKQEVLEQGILELLAWFNRGNGTLIVPGAYLEVIVNRS